MRLSRPCSTAPSAGPGRSSPNGRTAATKARPCSATTVAATMTFTFAPRSPNAVAISSSIFSDSHEQVASFINSSYANTYSAVVVALSYLIDPDTPKNDGTFRPITLIAKPGTVVRANPGAPVTLATNHCAQEILEAIIKALAPACPDRTMAGWGRRFRIAIQGKDPRS